MTDDDNNRIATFNGNNVTYDSDGNMTSGPGTNNTFLSYGYHARNRLLSAGGTTYAYDSAGNRTSLTNGTKGARLALLCILLLCRPLAATADQDGDYIYTVTNGVATISDFNSSYSGALSITNTLGNCPVTCIGSWAFFLCTNLTSVTLPPGITNVGNSAFFCCTSLSNVTIPDSVTAIGESAFYACGALADITIPDSVTTIGDQAVYLCASLTNVTIGNNVKSIGETAFSHCTQLTSVTIPASVTTVGEYAFSLCTSLTNITVDEANAYFSSLDGALFDKTQTTLIQVPGGKTGRYTIPNSVTTIRHDSLLKCTRLTNIVMGNNVIDIGPKAFYWCTSLTSVLIGNSVTTIETDAFSGCSSLISVTIPASVTSIGERVFSDCNSLTRIYFKGEAPRLIPSLSSYFSNATIYHLLDIRGWLTTYAQRPAVLWNPIFTTAGINAGAISCTVTGSADIPIAVDATTNLLNGPWLRLYATNLTAGSLDFTDSDATNYPTRYYRIAGP